MKINHLIIGSADVRESVSFYRELLGFREIPDDPGAPGGQVLEHDECGLLILPFDPARLPHPVHFALEVHGLDPFTRILQRAESMGLAPRSAPARDSRPGCEEFKRGGRTYRVFYVFDPSGVNLEVMTLR